MIGLDLLGATAASAPNANGTRNLKKGMRGDDVRALQQALTDAGFSTKGTDGAFGIDTVNALYAFQKAKGLAPDGIAGPAVYAALGMLTAPVVSNAAQALVAVARAQDAAQAAATAKAAAVTPEQKATAQQQADAALTQAAAAATLATTNGTPDVQAAAQAAQAAAQAAAGAATPEALKSAAALVQSVDVQVAKVAEVTPGAPEALVESGAKVDGAGFFSMQIVGPVKLWHALAGLSATTILGWLLLRKKAT